MNDSNDHACWTITTHLFVNSQQYDWGNTIHTVLGSANDSPVVEIKGPCKRPTCPISKKYELMVEKRWNVYIIVGMYIDYCYIICRANWWWALVDLGDVDKCLHTCNTLDLQVQSAAIVTTLASDYHWAQCKALIWNADLPKLRVSNLASKYLSRNVVSDQEVWRRQHAGHGDPLQNEK